MEELLASIANRSIDYLGPYIVKWLMRMERHRENMHPVRSKYAKNLSVRLIGVWHVLQNIAGQDDIDRLVRKRQTLQIFVSPTFNPLPRRKLWAEVF